MKKATIIATCLINSGVTTHSLPNVEASVEQSFREDFQGVDFNKWNTNLPDAQAQEIIKQFGTAYRIDVRRFIQDLM